MSNIAILNNDSADGALDQGEFRDDTLSFAGADTFKRGTILARLLVVIAITPSAVTGTGNGTVTAASVIGSDEVPKVGNWTLRCIAIATHGGTFRLEDPDGGIRGNVVLTAGSGGANAFEVAGIAFTINDGSTDFAVGDTFTLPVVASNKLIPLLKTGAGGARRPVGVLANELTRTGAGDLPCRLQIKGTWNKKRLIIDADGDDTNIDAPLIDALRACGITAVDVQQIAKIDNPQA